MTEISVPQARAVDPRQFRQAMGTFATGIAIVTTAWADEYHGMTMNSLTSVSLDPCMLLICPKKGSTTGRAIIRRGAFVVNILAESQAGLSDRFVGTIAERFDGLSLSFDESGLPLLPDCIAHISCAVSDIHEAGDHDIVLGEVIACSAGETPPLVFHRGALGRFHAH